MEQSTTQKSSLNVVDNMIMEKETDLPYIQLPMLLNNEKNGTIDTYDDTTDKDVKLTTKIGIKTANNELEIMKLEPVNERTTMKCNEIDGTRLISTEIEIEGIEIDETTTDPPIQC